MTQEIVKVNISFVAATLSSNPCCATKDVGGIKYHITDNHNFELPNECLNKCVYKKHGEDKYYCFKPGYKPVKCIESDKGNAKHYNIKLDFVNLRRYLDKK